MKAIHLMNYSADLNSAQYRVTADATHAELRVTEVPDEVSPETVARHANETCIAAPLRGAPHEVSYDLLGRGRLVNLYASQ